MNSAPKILLHNADTEDLVARLRHACPDAQISTCNSYDGLPAALTNTQPDIVYTVRFAGSVGYPRAALFGASGPAWVANGGAGTDHFGHWDTSRVTVTNAAGVAAEMMAEYVIGSCLHFTLDIPGLQADKANKTWRARCVTPLKGKTILIVGLGQTGRAIAQRAKAFGMIVHGTRARPQPMPNVDHVASSADLLALLPGADFIAVCTPLTPQTQGMIGSAQITAMKPEAVFVDVSRGGVTDQTALLNALGSGRLKGAALDVFETEPLPTSSPFWDIDNVLISPHCSSVYQGWETASFELFLGNLERWLQGAPLVNIVDPVRGY